uniref:Uncharacterized protein n=1 Tax=Fervidobacterium pennivorans TaxID=93466 RepID=A0A7V4NEX4_FERPE
MVISTIGGEHYLTPEFLTYKDKNVYDFIISRYNNVSFYATGRDAIFRIVEVVRDRILWLPDFLCESIYKPLKKSGVAVKFYHVKDDFRDQGTDKVRKTDFVYIINYFGLVDEALFRFENTIVDITHSFIIFDNDFNYTGKISICSLRKLLPIPDGALLAGYVKIEPTYEIRQSFVEKRTFGLLSRYYSYLNKFSSDENFYVLKEAEKLLDQSGTYGYSMSYLSQNLLKCVDFQQIAQKTKENYDYLKMKLKKHYPGFSQYFPVVFSSREERDNARQKLGKKGIFCPVHWDTSFLGVSNDLSDRIMSIPCDYRYGVSHTGKIINILGG